MNYYERHLGDYAKDAGHLTMIEQGAYTLLLDRYYTTERPIPADQAHRVCRARSKDEQKAVDSVLAEFFALADGAWVNARAEREIAKMQAKVKAAQENGKRGGRPKGTKTEPTGFSLGSDSETQGKAHQTPDTSHQSPVTIKHTQYATTDAARVCVLMKSAGIQDVNPGHPDLLALVGAGCSDDEFAGAAQSSAERGKGFAYTLGTLKRQREAAAKTAKTLHHGPLPTTESPRERAARERVEQFAPGAAAKRPTQTAEVIDVTARRLG